MSGETSKQRRRREELDVQLDRELEETFPASDPPKVTSPNSRRSDISDTLDERMSGGPHK